MNVLNFNVLWKLRDEIKKERKINKFVNFEISSRFNLLVTILFFFFFFLFLCIMLMFLFLSSFDLFLFHSLFRSFSFFFFFPYILSAFRFVWLMSYLTELLVQRNRKQERHTASWLISISTGPKRRQGFVLVSSKINHRSFRTDPNFFRSFDFRFFSFLIFRTSK